MAFTRYNTRGLMVNDNDGYKETFFEKRDIQRLTQYETARFYYPTYEERTGMALATLVWSSTSKLYNLADQYYGQVKLWWIIAWFNQKPTEAHFKTGDIFYVPTDITQVWEFFERSNGVV